MNIYVVSKKYSFMVKMAKSEKKGVNFKLFKRYMTVIQNVTEVEKLDLASLLHCTIPNNIKKETYYTLNHARKNELGDWVHFAYS